MNVHQKPTEVKGTRKPTKFGDANLEQFMKTKAAGLSILAAAFALRHADGRPSATVVQTGKMPRAPEMDNGAL